MILGQTFEPSDLGTIGLLVLLEGVLSVDNALVLGLLAGRLPAERAAKALVFGLAGAFAFRLAAVAAATFLLRWSALKLLGAIYLIYLSARQFLFAGRSRHPAPRKGPRRGFWMAVLAIELTDLAFAVDSILAAVALVGPPPPGWPADRLHPKFWVIVTGGMLGVILTRFAAAGCMKLIKAFPRLETCAYLIVLLVAGKLLMEWKYRSGFNFHDPRHAPFWVFWGGVAGCLIVGLIPKPAGHDAATG
jgi:YkoY family integral membrane protein